MKNKTMTLGVVFAILTIMISITGPVLAAPPVPLGILDPTTIPKFVNQLYVPGQVSLAPPPIYVPVNVTDANNNVIRQDYMINVTQFTEQILPTVDALNNPTGFGPTTVWGYGGIAKDGVTGATLGYVRNSPAPSFEAIRGIPIRVTWINNITTPHLFPVDPTLHWANPNNIPMMDAIMQAQQGLAPPYPPGYNGVPIPIPNTTPVQYYNPDGWNAQSPVPIVTHLHGGEVPSAFDGGPDEWFTWGWKTRFAL